jgi:hypothetical protein
MNKSPLDMRWGELKANIRFVMHSDDYTEDEKAAWQTIYLSWLVALGLVKDSPNKAQMLLN